MSPKLSLFVRSLFVFALFIALWQIVVIGFKLPVYLFPGPFVVAKTIVTRYPTLLQSLWISTEAAAGGLFFSTVIGVTVALLFAQSRSLRQVLYPYTLLLQTIPIIAVAPLIIMWCGTGLMAVTVVATIICVTPIIINTTQGLISVDENLIHLFLMHQATPAQILFKLRMPNAIPNLFVGIRISAGISVIGAIAGELFAGSARVGVGGLGYSITYANAQLDTPYLFALAFAASVLGFVFFFIGMFLEWYFLHNWHESNRSQLPE